MDFTLLSELDLDEFLDLGAEYGIQLNSTSKITQAEQLFDQLQLLNVKITYPVVDLYIASNYIGPKDKTYSTDEILNLSSDQIRFFSKIFPIDLNDDDQTNRARIYRILRYLDLISDPNLEILELVSQSTILQQLCNELTLKELDNLMQSLNWDKITCQIPISDKDKHLNSISELPRGAYKYLDSIEECGSCEKLERLIFDKDMLGIKTLISLGMDPRLEICDKDAGSVLILASSVGFDELVQYLLEIGVDPNSRNKRGETSITDSVSPARFGVVTKLLDYGADINSKNQYGDTALIMASMNDEVSMVKFLIERGANLDLQNNAGDTALITTVIFYEDYDDDDDMDDIKLLLDAGADIEIKNRDGYTAFTLAIQKTDWNVANLLLDHGAQSILLGQGEEEDTMSDERLDEVEDYIDKFIYYVLDGGPDLIKTLLTLGMDINIVGSHDNLLTLAISRNPELVPYLLELGADPNDIVIHHPMYIALKKGDPEIVRALLQYGANPNVRYGSITPYDLVPPETL